jgi:uncharacterized protein involved in cysteine biosynthesis
MGKTTDEIVTDIDQTRQELQSNIEELETRMKEITDWRSWVQRHPVPMIVLAMVGGVLLSSLAGALGTSRTD